MGKTEWHKAAIVGGALGPMTFSDDFPEMLETDYADLSRLGYKLTSDATGAYNCFAWAMDDKHNWWEPERYWPPGASNEELSVRSLMGAFATKGYEACEDGRLEREYERVAIFADSQGRPTHAARQLGDGHWTSKLGECPDIKHAHVEAVAGVAYGSVVGFMRRRRKRPRWGARRGR